MVLRHSARWYSALDARTSHGSSEVKPERTEFIPLWGAAMGMPHQCRRTMWMDVFDRLSQAVKPPRLSSEGSAEVDALAEAVGDPALSLNAAQCI